jgi:predicted nucleotidyltransferase
VEQALRAYQQLYQADEQRARLRLLRQNAREMMQLLAQFDPHLSGSVLSGSAGKYSDINIHLFTDSVKDVEMFLLNRQIPYRSRERRVYIGGEARSVPNFSVSTDDADFDITVFAPRDRRYQLRTTAEGKPFDRARIDWLDSVLESAGTAGAAANPL